MAARTNKREPYWSWYKISTSTKFKISSVQWDYLKLLLKEWTKNTMYIGEAKFTNSFKAA